MANEELLNQCKIGLNLSFESTEFDSILTQKLLAVQSFMRNAGVSESKMDDPLAVSVIVMGVGDLWQIDSGEVKFSPAFNTLLTQLTYDEVVEE
ncbi:hypothetical protein VQL36_05525 [Chengkuizengella sp. SCS-71B]|uniref:hypothetical protein n=1 Tax=Chengkuizengella sp. SCS-71B TaxID=3115290 RepID=UPI0032C2487D